MLKILAIDTATERCSVALRLGGASIEREAETPRAHAELVLPMVQSVLQEGDVRLEQLDAIAYGRGPGAFTGLRIAIGVVQGLAFGAGVQTLGVSDLAAVAQQIAGVGDRILVCMDARMGEVYCGEFRCEPTTGLVVASGAEALLHPDQVEIREATRFAGTGFRAYPSLGANRAFADLLPHAREIALLAEPALHAGHGRPAAEAQPVYLRDRVAVAKPR